METMSSEKKQERQKKRARTVERMKIHEFCHSFASKGECPFGDSCKFNHDYDTFLGTLADTFNKQKCWRDSLVDSVGATERGPFTFPHPPFHKTYESSPGEETSVVMHSHNNGVMAVCISKGHPIFASTSEIESVEICPKINFEVGDVLAKIIMADKLTFDLRTPIPGMFLEANDVLKENPKLLLSDPTFKGYLILMKIKSPFNFFMSRYFATLAVTSEFAEEGADAD